MAKIRQLSFAVATTGVGRIDFSQDVQRSVEPVTSGWQQTYKDYQTFALGVGETGQAEVIINPTLTLLLYNAYLSCFPASDISLEVFSWNPTTGAYGALPQFTKIGNQFVDIFLDRGLVLNSKYLIAATNLGAAPIDCFYSALGVVVLQSVLESMSVGYSVVGVGGWQSVIP